MPDLAPLRPGDPASVGAYTLAGRIGEGGQGLVYLATAPDGAKVAVKLLRTDLAGDEEASVRFVREVELARRVAPFCTAQMIETGLVNGRPYIVSEYIDGPTLSDVVRVEGPRAGTALHRLAIGTVTALVAIHQAGIVHRDFKPSNVLLASDGPRVIDFGIAKALDLTSTLTASAIGTPSFMAPEQLSAGSPGAAADMFAWACTLLFAASGQAPFGQDSVPAVVNRIMNTEADVGVIADPALRALVADCLAKDPARRPAAQQALMRLLGQAQGPVPYPMGPYGTGGGPGGSPGFPPGQDAAPGPGAPGFSAPDPGRGAPPQGFPGPGAGGPGPGVPSPGGPGFSGPGAGGPGPGVPSPGGPGFSGPGGSYPGGAGVPGGFTGHGGSGGAGGPDAARLLWQGSAAAAGPGYAPYPPPPTRASGGRGTGWIVAGAAVATVVLLAAGAFVVNRVASLPGPGPTATQAVPSGTPSPSPTPTPVDTLTATPPTTTIRLPGTSVEIEERPTDPVKLASYTVESGKRLYVRQPGTARFARDSRYFEYALDHDGTRALGTDVDYNDDRKALLSVIDHRTGNRRAIEVSAAPIFPTTPRWSPDGRLALVTLYRATASASVEYGYGIVDVDAGTARTYRVKEKGAGEWRFFWNSRGDEVGTWVNGVMTFYDLEGGKLRTVRGAGEPVWVEGDDVSPGGDRFLAHCASSASTICAHPTGGDGEAERVPFTSQRLIGWWDDEHLAVWRAKGAGYEAVVIDLSGKVHRVLATAQKRAEFDKMAFRFSRGTP
ncbi:serine/threonine-protein kinase [Nonomuraea sp. MCN248]|uniref:Serine/threonine-protein kinase n=1 Tax=Nonomuraea corallina TaxID=2989783 RepID=A0ABT4SPG9_9ACTN|nr:serine/threonine-protein kinase [Nonomuraea corallina]MDA0638925.1 serine/threonine-protein kinase [Nonomuraea corallina]